MISKMKYNLANFLSIGLTALLLSLSSCSDDDDSSMDASLENKTSGFVIVGNTASGTARVKYTEELPTGTFDLSDGADFPGFDPRTIYDHALFVRTPSPGQSSSFSKYVVNNTGELVEAGRIPTGLGPFRIMVRDAQVGVFQDPDRPSQITVFNPTSLVITSTINMSDGFVPGGINPRYTQFYFRGNDVFAPIDAGANREFTSFILHQANITNSFVEDTQREGNGENIISNFYNYLHHNNLDNAGNLYIPDGGNHEGEGIPGRINKIPAGSNEIDPTYVFEPARELNPQNIFLPTFNHFYVIDNNKAIARVNAETPRQAIDIVQAAGDVTVFTRRDMFEHEGLFYLPVVVGGANRQNSYYRYDPRTGTSEKAFDVTGADIVGVFNLANNN